jgi:tetratricopeptide (TPR) repeat protein
MRHSKKILILASSILFFCLFACKNRSQKPNPELGSLNLLRGDILLCGSGDFGDVSFSFSCSYETRDNFNLAISLLHSFEYEEAEKAFAKVIDVDPNCAMGYWGVAMCNFHALWRPPTEDDLKKGSLAIKIARSLKDKTGRETEYIEAIALFYDNWRTIDHKIRIAKFENAMEQIHRTYPDDKEASIFYALALNSAADLADKTYKNRRKAGEILENLLPDQPNHPGITHYIIHSYDYPELASMALSAARNYALVAPSSSHAQHMPSHIFTRLGLWDESIQSNLNATTSAQCYAEQVEMDGKWDEEIHGTDYLVYAYLQKGQTDDAKKLLDYLLSVKSIYPIGVKGAYPTAAIPARFYLETRKWDAAAKLGMSSNDYPADKFPWSNGIIHFARILGALHTNDLTSAKIDFEKLSECHQYLLNKNDVYMANQVNIMLKTGEAWIQFYEDNKEEAFALMNEAVEMEFKTEKHSLTPGELAPAQEILGDLLLAANRPFEALKAYELDIKRHPNRFNGIYGAAQAAKQSGNNDKAKLYFEKLLKLTENADSDRTEVKEAEAYINRKTI